MNNQTKTPLVTVAITTYKRPEDMVYRAVQSVIKQTYDNLEIFIIDDSPSSYCERETICKRINDIGDKRITYLFNDRNIGACASRNKAIMLSKGDFFIYVDDDDELLPECIEKRVKKFTKPEIGLVYSDCIFVDEYRNVEYESKQKKLNGKVFEQLLIENFVLAFPMIRKECFTTCGMFNESLPASQDLEMWLRISEKYEIDYVDEPLSRIHLHKGERITKDPNKKIVGFEVIYNSYRDYILLHPHINHIKTRQIIPYYIHSGQVKKGFDSLIKAIKLEPLDFSGNTYSIILAFWSLTKAKFAKKKQ